MKSPPAAEASIAMRIQMTIQREPSVLLVAGWAAVVAAAMVVGGAVTLFGGDADSTAIPTGVPVATTPQTLSEFAKTHHTPVYWAGGLPARKLELTTTREATFVRYLPKGVQAGDPRATFTTIATYSLPNAYATAAGRRTQPGMASRKTPGGGLAVWSRQKPTSVYVAFRGVPHLVEVYDDRGREALELALSGRLRPVG
jgi:hypothetical protein